MELREMFIFVDRENNMIYWRCQKLKVDYLNSKNPRLHTDEILIALSASAAVNPIAELALSQLPKLKGCQAHTSVMLSSVDIKTFKKLGVQLTSEAVNERQILS